MRQSRKEHGGLKAGQAAIQTGGESKNRRQPTRTARYLINPFRVKTSS